MSERGRGSQQFQKGKSQNEGAWGGRSEQQSSNQPQNERAPPNFTDADAFGPPLGGGKRQNKKKGAATPAPQAAQQSSARSESQPKPQQPAQPRPQQQPQPQQTPRQQQPPAWGAPQPSQNIPAGSASAWGPGSNTGAIPRTPRVQPSSSVAPAVSHSDTVASTSRGPPPARQQTEGRNEGARGSIRENQRERGESLQLTRPAHVKSAKQGTSGTRFKIMTNYFALNNMKNVQWQIFHYHVEFSPEIDNAAFRNFLLVNRVPNLRGFLYDRGASIYTVSELEVGADNKLEVSTRDKDGQDILIIIKRVGLISMQEYQSLQVINIIVKKALRALNLELIGRDYYDPVARISVPQHHLELWPGYTTSVRQHERSLLMMAEIKHKLMRTETVLDILRRCYSEYRNDWQQRFQQEVLGMIVLTRYNNKTYRISDVVFELNPMSTFERRDGPITYMDYYTEKNKKITDPAQRFQITDRSQPMLRSTPTERDIRGARGRDEEAQPINLIPELCCPTGFTDEMRRNFNLMRDLAQHTRVGPALRVQKLLAFNGRLQGTPASITCFNDWALNLDKNLVRLDARQLPAESIGLGGQRNVTADPRADWTNSLQGRNTMYSCAPDLNNRWVAVLPSALQSDARRFIDKLREVSRAMGFVMAEPTIISVPDDRSVTLTRVLEEQCSRNIPFVLIAVSNNQSERYSSIKKVCTVRYAVPSQVVTRRVMDPRDMRKMTSVATKVGIQINAKLGGRPWYVDPRLTDCMFIGYDVCHDTRDRARSYGALVATMDMKTSPRYFSIVSAHTNGEELSNNLAINVINALKQYQAEHNNKLPTRICFYRDGVGEGQTNYVYEHELVHLRTMLKQYYGDLPPVKLAFIIVSKRINTKFFVESGNGQVNNVPPGTVVDDVVTLPERYDFFLVSQHVGQGTATPTNYNVIYDTFGMPPDKLQHLTYKMCHLYYNWSGTTRVPAVCQYAHKLAFLVGNYLHQPPSGGLNRYLHFL